MVNNLHILIFTFHLSAADSMYHSFHYILYNIIYTVWTELRPQNLSDHKHMSDLLTLRGDTNYMQSLMLIYILQVLTDSVGL